MNNRPNANAPLLRTFIFLGLITLQPLSHAELIAFDLHNSQSHRLIQYNNPFQNAFTHSIDDSFQVHQLGVSTISSGLLDTSTTGSDSLGLINAEDDFDSFFAVQDVDNPANTKGHATASWVFDISAATNLSLSLDIAAMGDFELSDWFRWDYAIDNLTRQPLFELRSDQTKTQSYQLASGYSTVINDPLSLNNQLLNNHFQTFSGQLFGQGSQLELFFTAQQNGGNEVLAFRNLEVAGQLQPFNGASVPSPSTLSLLLLGIVWFSRRHFKFARIKNSCRL
jgi:hypothetical protein